MQKRGIFALAASALAIALIATPAYAQRGGRGGGGGGRGWGGGGYGGGVYHGGYGGYGNGYYHGGYGNGYYHNGGYYGGYPGYGIGFGLGGIGLGYYGNGYAYDGGYPVYYGDSAFSASNGFYEGAQPYGPVVGGMSNYQAQNPNAPAIVGNAPTVAMQSFYSGPSTSTGKAELTVKVPADAQLWLGTMQSGQQGTERRFNFPALTGSNLFTLRATWMENGQPVTREKQVNVKAGENSTVDLTQAGNDKPATNTPTERNPAPGTERNPAPGTERNSAPGTERNPAPGTAFEIKKDTPPRPSTDVPPKK